MAKYLAHLLGCLCLTIALSSCGQKVQQGLEEIPAKQSLDVSPIQQSIRLSVEGLPRRGDGL